MSGTHTIEQHFDNRDSRVRAVYEEILRASRALGPVREDPKKTSIHLVRRTAFAGVATRKDALILTIKSGEDIRSPRFVRREQVSAHRWHLEVRLEQPSEVNRELETWLSRAYDLAG